VAKNLKEGFFDILPAFVFAYAVKEWGQWKFHDIAHHHRD
jgi:hypothetical protein